MINDVVAVTVAVSFQLTLFHGNYWPVKVLGVLKHQSSYWLFVSEPYMIRFYQLISAVLSLKLVSFSLETLSDCSLIGMSSPDWRSESYTYIKRTNLMLWTMVTCTWFALTSLIRVAASYSPFNHIFDFTKMSSVASARSMLLTPSSLRLLY